MPSHDGVRHHAGPGPVRVGLLPEAVACVLLVTAVVAEAQILLRSFHPWPTLLVGVAGGLALAVALLRHVPSRRGESLGAGAALAVAVVASALNAAVPARWVFVTRDPGFYTVTARWLVDHPSPLISRAASAFGGLPDSTVAGFYTTGDQWSPQSSHLVPALAAIGGQLGDRGLFASGTVLGLVSLLCLYGAARLLLGPWWGLLPVVALAASLPFATFTRGIYTEPLAMAAAMGAVTLTIHFLRRPRLALAIAAGGLAGVPAMTRIDGLAITIPLVVAVFVAPAISSRVPERDPWRAQLLYVSASCLTVAAGFAELKVNAPRYLSDLGPQVRELGALAVVALAGCAVLGAISRTAPWRRHVREPGHTVAARLAAGVVLIAFAGLAARPLFWQGRAFEPGSAYATTVARLQRAAGVPIDPTRSYDERSLEWIVWYLGLPTVVLAVLGLALLAACAIRRRATAPVVVLLLTGAVSAIYLNRVSITPDQVWASRRFLPVIFPGFLLAAGFALTRLARRGRAATAVAVVLALVVAAMPLRSLLPVARTPETSGWAGPVTAVCARTHGGRVLLGYTLNVSLGATLRAFCDTPTSALTTSRRSALRRVAGVRPTPLYVLTARPPAQRGYDGRPFLQVVERSYERPLFGPPKAITRERSRLYLSRVADSGQLVPVT